MGGGQALDKPGNHKTITIKINGKDRPVEKEKKQSSPEEADNRILEFKNYERLSLQESAAAQEVDEEDEFDWILPEIDEDEELQEYKIMSHSKPKKGKAFKNNKPSSLKNTKKGILPSILLTVFLAVILGTSLGVLMLKMVISDSAKETGTLPTEEVTPSEEPSSATPGTESIELPPITGYVIQGGAFSNTEAAGGEATSMTEKGFPAKVIEMESNAFLFVGIADNLPNAKSLGSQLQGIDTFAKEVVLGGGTKSELSAAEKQVLELAPALYGILSQISTSASLTNSIPADLQDSLSAQLEQWNSLKDTKNESIQQLKGELDSAITNLTNYEEKKDSSLLVKTQQNLLNFIAGYQAL